jgi:hypothetical protein
MQWTPLDGSLLPVSRQEISLTSWQLRDQSTLFTVHPSQKDCNRDGIKCKGRWSVVWALVPSNNIQPVVRHEIHVNGFKKERKIPVRYT